MIALDLSALNPILTLLWIATLIHVGIESCTKKRVGRPFWHIVLVGLAAWPLGYLLWIFYWPGNLIKSKATKASEAWVESICSRKS